jgi:hypothetical protein
MMNAREIGSSKPFDEVVRNADRVGDDCERRIHRAAGREKRRIDDIKVIQVVRAAVHVQNRLLRVHTEAACPVLMTDALEIDVFLEIRMDFKCMGDMPRLLKDLDPALIEPRERFLVILRVFEPDSAINDSHAVVGIGQVFSHHGTACVFIISSTTAGVSGGASPLSISYWNDPIGWMLPIGYG